MLPRLSRVSRFVPPLMLLALAALPRASAASGGPDGTWSSLDATAPAPSLRREYVSVFDQQRDRYLIFGGAGPSAPNPSSLLNEVWTLSLDTPTPAWTALAIEPGPGPRHSAQSGYDPARERLIIFGGYGSHHPGDAADYLNDAWELQLNTGQPAWTELFPTGTPPSGRLAGASIYDPIRQRLVVFGGTVGATTDVYTLDLSSEGAPAWSVLPVAGTPPVAGYGKTAIYDPVRDRMLMFAGSTSDNYYGVVNDTWELTLGDSPTWNQLAPTGTPPSARRSLTSIYDPIRDRMVVFAGWDNLDTPTSFLDDTYALSLAGDPAWTALAPTDGPPVGRDAIDGVYDAPRDRFVVFGGWSGLSMLNDTWFLDFGSHGDDATLTPNAQAQVGVAQISWDVAGATGSRVGVFRRAGSGKWSSIATPQLNAQGHLDFADHAVSPGAHYAYQVAVASHVGEQFGGEVAVDMPTLVGVIDTPGLQFALSPVRPNPITGGRFDVAFTLPRAGAARLDLYDVAGRRVTGLDAGALGVGTHTVTLGSGARIAPGLYFVRLTAPGVSLEQRAVIAAN
jgi:hypothetical protein